ncbi:M23 family metallopeptidase [Allokutzneria albata]|uniref:Peptidase family M23 n=1 Tax=Allokutzneria albata TaxID=211114 RepID=A0A1H0ASQ7_ALLAB|nr:M23 family metallopeptidase [Allokutzneria albata]SDN36532.1 Peptidase family M23 [Allokutzneria albata]
MKKHPVIALAAACALSLTLLSTTATAAPRPNFQLPFPCGQTWAMTTYVGHAPDDKKVDMFRVDGATEGAHVVAAAPGVVNEIHPRSGGVEINHGDGWFTLYLHMSIRTVNVGDRVLRGQRIGTVGKVNTDVAHLHYELLRDANGNNNGENGEWVKPIFNGVEYTMDPNRPFNLRSNNC